MIRFKLAVVEDVLGKPLETIKAVLIKDGTELCTVGFLGREVAALVPSQRSKYIDKFAQVLELYDDNENSMMRKKTKRNGFILLDGGYSRPARSRFDCSSPQ